MVWETERRGATTQSMTEEGTNRRGAPSTPIPASVTQKVAANGPAQPAGASCLTPCQHQEWKSQKERKVEANGQKPGWHTGGGGKLVLKFHCFPRAPSPRHYT